MKKKKALFTYARNESLYLPLWLSHHLKSFAVEDIYLLDNNTCDGSVKKAISEGQLLRENVFHISCSDQEFTSQWLSDRATELQNKLLENYQWTILAEADELISIDPQYFRGWDDFLEIALKSNEKVFRATGYDVVHDVSVEEKIDLKKNILAQRSKARLWLPKLNGGKMLFSKPILARDKIKLRAGGHDIVNGESRIPLNVQIIDGLLLFHLNMFDYDLCVQRRLDRVPTGQSKINGDRLYVGEELLREMKQYLTSPAAVKIPERFKSLL